MSATDPDALVALMPGDLPLIAAGDVEATLAMARRDRLVIVPSADGGTGALVFPAGLALPLAFGRGSFGKHLQAAADLGLTSVVAGAETLAFDLDHPADFGAVLARGGDTLTARVLREHARPREAAA
jgi:2-phospho-L-lactate guanylyltransferase (CobY/MobA/RfbA family)